MEAQIAVSSTLSYELREALLIYRTDASPYRAGGNAFVTRHKVLHGKYKGPELGPGASLTQEDLSSFMQALRGAAPIEFLPANVLVRTEQCIVWWSRPSIRPMFYPTREGSETAVLSGRRFPQPALIFRARQGSLEVRAIEGDQRPERNTELARAPHWNVNDRGVVCLGTSATPAGLSVDTLPQWERAFFEFTFTHANSAQRLTAHPDGFVAIWKSLQGEAHFPGNYLAGAGETLGQFIDR